MPVGDFFRNSIIKDSINEKKISDQAIDLMSSSDEKSLRASKPSPKYKKMSTEKKNSGANVTDLFYDKKDSTQRSKSTDIVPSQSKLTTEKPYYQNMSKVLAKYRN